MDPFAQGLSDDYIDEEGEGSESMDDRDILTEEIVAQLLEGDL